MSKKPGDWLRVWWNRLIGCRRGHKDFWYVAPRPGASITGYCEACERFYNERSELPTQEG